MKKFDSNPKLFWSKIWNIEHVSILRHIYYSTELYESFLCAAKSKVFPIKIKLSPFSVFTIYFISLEK